MSFFKSFLGAAFAQSARDSKKRQEELDAWNKLFDEATDMSSEFSNYLTRLGITDSYVSPPASELAEEGRAAVNAEKRKIENYKKKISEFIHLGGHPSNIWYIEKIDDYIALLHSSFSLCRDSPPVAPVSWHCRRFVGVSQKGRVVTPPQGIAQNQASIPQIF